MTLPSACTATACALSMPFWKLAKTTPCSPKLLSVEVAMNSSRFSNNSVTQVVGGLGLLMFSRFLMPSEVLVAGAMDLTREIILLSRHLHQFLRIRRGLEGVWGGWSRLR